MTSARIFRISGLVLLAGALAFGMHVVLRSVLTAGPDASVFARHPLWPPLNALGVTGAILVLLGLPAVGAWISGVGPSGLVGVALLAVAWMFFGLFLSLY